MKLNVPGIRIGHASDFKGLTGCTVILCEEGAVAGMDPRGTASGSRQLDSLYPLHLVDRAQAILLVGGSIFGLQATDGVLRYLEERNKGFDVTIGVVPIVPTAVIFDLSLGDPKARPTAEMGYSACVNAKTEAIEEGSVGVGTGAKVGNIGGIERAMKGGLGVSTISHETGLDVLAVAAVNAFGDVRDYQTGKILAGTRVERDSLQLADSAKLLRNMTEVPPHLFQQNTTLAVVATNARLSKLEAIKVSQMATNGLIKTISPALTLYDGDMVFVLATGRIKAHINLVGYLSEVAIAEAINRAIRLADGFGAIPAHKDLQRGTVS